MKKYPREKLSAQAKPSSAGGARKIAHKNKLLKPCGPGKTGRNQDVPLRNVSRAKAARELTKAKSAIKRNTIAATSHGKKIKRALERLAKAQTEMATRGLDLLNVAHEIERNAVEAYKDVLIVSLLQDDLLNSLKTLHQVMVGSVAEHALTIEAVLNWLGRHFDLTEHLRVGQRVEISTDRLSQFNLEAETLSPPGALVQIDVLIPGWKRRDKLIVPPTVKVVLPSTSTKPTAPSGSRA